MGSRRGCKSDTGGGSEVHGLHAPRTRGTQMGIIIIIGTKSCDCASEDTVGIPLVVCGRLAWTGMPRTVGDEAMELETAGGVGTELGIEVDTLGLGSPAASGSRISSTSFSLYCRFLPLL